MRPIAVVAVGSLGDYDNAPPEIVERDAQGRGSACPLEEVAFARPLGAAAAAVTTHGSRQEQAFANSSRFSVIRAFSAIIS